MPNSSGGREKAKNLRGGGAGQFDGPKNYEYFGGLVKQKYMFDMSFRGLF